MKQTASGCPAGLQKLWGLLRAPALFSCLAVVAAAEAPPDGEAWIEELTATHDKQGGYIAVYTFEVDKKSLQATLAIDFESGLGAAHVLAESVEEVIDMRQWNTPDDVVFIEMNGERSRMSGLRREMATMTKELSELISLIKNGERIEIPWNNEISWRPEFLLVSDGINLGLGVATTHDPPWKSAVEDAPIHEFDEDSVTFHSEQHGLLTISREHGVLLRQEVKTLEGENRVLELKDLVKNPGRDKVLALTSEWPTDGAEEIGGIALTEAFGAFRLFAFQAIVKAVSSDMLAIGDVEEWLRFQRESLREIVAPWVMRGPQYVEGAEIWKPLLDQVEVSVEEMLWDKGVDLEGGDAVKRSLREIATRDRARRPIIEMLADRDEYRESVIREMFAGQTLEAGDEAGGKARDLIMASLTKAYLDAIFDLKANQEWGAVEGNPGGNLPESTF